MLRLNLPKEPYWLDLPKGIRVKVHPLSTALMSAAQGLALKEGRKFEGNSEDEHIRLGLMESALIKALARQAIIEWQGVLSPEENQPAPLIPEAINTLMDVWFIAQDFWTQYTSSQDLLEKEGNVSGLVADGTSGTGPITVKDAKPKNSPAAKGKRVHSRENTVPTFKTNRSRKKALKCGRS